MKKRHLLPVTAMTALLAATAVYAEDEPASVGTDQTSGTTTMTPPGTEMSRSGHSTKNADLTDNDYVTLSGTVDQVLGEDEFTLNYGNGKIKVDTNDSWPELFKQQKGGVGYLIKSGDKVTVTGRVDKNWTTANEIEAEAVSYALGNFVMTYYTPNMRKNMASHTSPYFSTGGRLSLTGTVTEVKNDEEFILQYPGGTIQVDTDKIDIPVNRRIEVGERLTVYGTYDEGIMKRNEIKADTINRTYYFTRG